MRLIKFDELSECPFCGYDEFYTTEYVYGTLYYKERFDGKEAHNEELYDGLNTRKHSGRAYCRNCDKYLGNRVNNTISKSVERKLCK